MSATDNPTQQITKTNQRLFDRYAVVFMKPESPEVFVTYAQKLGGWLSDFKAYYGAARPEIIKLLLIAQRTICTSLNADPSTFNVSHYPNDVMVQAYANLVRTVERFQEYFRQEPGSLTHIQALVSTVHSPFQPTISSNQTTTLNQQHLNTGISNPGLTRSTVEHEPEVVIIPKPANFPDHTKKEVGSVSSPATISSNATVKSTRPKAKKRKTIDFNLLVEEDIKGLVEKKAAQPSSFQHSEKDAIGNVFATATMQEALVPEKHLVLVTETPVEEHNPMLDIKSGTSLPLLDSQPLSEPQPPLDQQPLPQFHPPPESKTESLAPSQPLLESNPISESQAPSQPPLEPNPLSESHSPSQPPPESNSPSEFQAPPQSQALLEDQFPPESQPQISESRDLSDPLRSQSPPGKFGTSIHVIASQGGLAYQGRMTISFNISDSTYTMISNWVKVNSNRNRNENIPFKSCICFSFGCYLTIDLKKNTNNTSFEDQFESTCSTWPPYGSLSMNVLFNGIQQSIPLAPPMKLTPNTLVDMCPFIIPGENKFDIAQRQDLSQYTFVLYAHWPSKEQLAQVRQNRKKEQDWKNWMLEVTRPLKVPSLDYSQAV